MAITKISENEDDKLTVNINNGDLRALDEIKQLWGFKDQASVLRFALAALKITHDGDLYAIQKDGTKRLLKPIDELLTHYEHKDIARGQQ
jgi:hypothetical protein